MPKNRTTTGYARLAQTEEDDDRDDLDHEDPFADQPTLSGSSAQYAPVQPGRRNERMKAPTKDSPSHRNGESFPLRERSNSGVDVKAINARLERWADEIASKFKIKRGRKSVDEEHLEIQHSVFQAPDWIRPATVEDLATDPTEGEHLSKEEFDEIVESVRVAIEMGTHPKLIAQGSSGSYFARNTEGKTVAVFKPKDEEPYASRNPKWTKWIHRNLFPFGFGRACLIPNLSYVSEAAAYVLDRRLRTNLVPYTDIVSLSSKSFFYDFWDRRAFYRKKKPLPEKIGSFQIFLKGFKDANIFLKEHPWPDQHNASLLADGAVRKKRKRRWTEDCRPGGPRDSDDEYDDENGSQGDDVAARRRMFWTEKLQQNFREQLEKLVILDYIMRNTDRGLDNWMIRINRKTEEATIVAEPPKENGIARQASPNGATGQTKGTDEPYRRQQERMLAVSRTGTPLNLPENEEEVSVSLGAIDNSLSWPWKHPDAWRSYPFGWLFLPVSLIGQPFSEATRHHFLPLLSSKTWWAETQLQLRRCFMQDDDFQERMYAKQMAVVKGQAWNVVETLKTPDHGPLELTRRARVCVWDDLVDVPVVVPLRAASPDTKRRHEGLAASLSGEREEMDISAAHASAPQAQHDLLGGSSPKQGKTNRFNISRQSSQLDVGTDSRDDELQAVDSEPLSPDFVQEFAVHSPSKGPRHSGSYFPPRRPNAYAHHPRMSYDEPRTLSSRHHHRRFSVGGGPRGRDIRGSIPFLDEGDEGDLGYTAAGDREGNRKKVIVERLETVKGGKPFFTWC
ncbi:hypothetical protein E2P81_ATG05257 [Venturia nashicola]|uniref:Phosphatidylinositol 4-kinase n=1 Tax=Venturia nashicola TaxID=86259 RepID=A0A4Z1PF96_9PEZI|nr:hypothetical protein E6O75_ATG05386 [Venturia nashicola]TLD32281.1 hypothetical protein E2P81_ATG05257 [Venturia nashicola]